ncbi:hypothetical protein TCSYLVIO_006752 [Trypanosoma cruzi]|nr:hypothetical protein TCSYLVIO_006752 [Trypanosoma cruzi]
MLVLLIGPLRPHFAPHHMSSCSVGTITRATARCHHKTRAARHPTRTAQLRPAGTAGSKAQSRLFRPAVPMALGVALARLGGRWSVRHAAALQRLSVKQSRSTVPAATQCATNHNTATLSYLFCFIHVVCLFAPSITQKISAHLHKREERKRKGDTIPPSRSGPTLSSTHHHRRTGDRSHIAESAPQCAPRHRAVNDGRDAAMHRPAPFSHHSSIACPHKATNRIRVHTNPTNTLTR